MPLTDRGKVVQRGGDVEVIRSDGSLKHAQRVA